MARGMDKELLFGPMAVNIVDNINTIKDTEKELINSKTEQNTLANFLKISSMEMDCIQRQMDNK